MTDALTQADVKAGLEPGVIPYIIVEGAAEEVGVIPAEDGKRQMGDSDRPVRRAVGVQRKRQKERLSDRHH